jgi:type II secretory pathway component PulC
MRLVAGLFALTLTTSLALADEAKPPEPQPAAPPAKIALRVVEVLLDSHQALLYDKQRGTHVLVDEGGEIDGYKVQAIEDDDVTLAAEGKEVILAAPARRRWRGPVKAATPAKAATPEKPAKVAAKEVVAPVIIADENGVRTVISPAKAEPAEADPAKDEPADPYFVAEPPTLTPYDEVEGETEHPADPYTLPEGTETVTAANPYDDAPVEEAAPVDEAAPAEEAAPPAPPPAVATATTAVIARRDLDAALADFGTLTRSLRGTFQPNGAKLEHISTDSVFAKAGLREGDVVMAVDGRPVRSIDDAAELYVRAQTTRATNVQILRAGRAITLKVQIR